MDPIMMILAALAIGAAHGTEHVGSQAIKDGYSTLKGALSRKFAGDRQAEQELVLYEERPSAPAIPLAEKLKARGANEDAEILNAAAAVLKAAEAAGIGTKYNINVSGGKVGIIGDNGSVTMH